MRASSRRASVPRPAVCAPPPLLALFVLAGCGAPDTAAPGLPLLAAAPAMPWYAAGPTPGAACGEPRAVGRVAHPAVRETSGLAASPRRDDLYFLHNDSGDVARLFAIDGAGATVAEIHLAGATAFDCEGLAVGPAEDGSPALYLGDFGDNHHERAAITILRVEEPLLAPGGPTRGALPSSRTTPLSFVYPGGEHPDAEALLVDPRGGELLVVTKERRGPPRLFGARPPFRTGEPPRALALRGTVRLPDDARSPLVTDAALAPAGDAVLIRTYDDAFLYRRRGDEDLAATLARVPARVPVAPERQGEAIAFTRDGRAYLTISEGDHPTIWRVDLCDPPDGDAGGDGAV